ncbi:hypothetical protein E2I00_017134 [Balaenoptera physalus]|uniref:Uncharacterized protein n=1 Tax=Balaenoptera physalus TaxID=9770 RepID=A0A6A1Q705_BALPH|nr:hypothetical protein E2I00_017134 [Balaenoptera physalus]
MIHLGFQPKVQIHLSVHFVSSLHFSYLFLLGLHVGFLQVFYSLRLYGYCKSGLCSILQKNSKENPCF